MLPARAVRRRPWDAMGGVVVEDGGRLAGGLAAHIRDVPDFPRPGVLFKDLTTLFKDATAFRDACDALVERHRGIPLDLVAAIESRGFPLGGVLAHQMGVGLIPVRKAGKLPAATLSAGYSLEYGEAVLEIHRDAIAPGQRVLLVDDVLATGGSAAATVHLIRELGGVVVGGAFLVELATLGGRARLDVPVVSLVTY